MGRNVMLMRYKRYANPRHRKRKKERERETDPPPLFPATNQHQLRWKNPPSGPESPASRKHLSASLTNRIVCGSCAETGVKTLQLASSLKLIFSPLFYFY